MQTWLLYYVLVSNYQPPSDLHQVVRACIPSAISLVLCLLAGGVIVLGALLNQSITLGTALPDLFEGEWGLAYTNSVVRPILALFSNLTFNKMLYLMAWGLAGCLVYILLSYASLLFRDAYGATHDIQWMSRNQVVQRPALKEFWAGFVWRLGVFVVLVPAFLLVLQIPLGWLNRNAPDVVLGHFSTSDAVAHLVITAFGLAFAGHLLVVTLRLLTQRTRIFGDNPL